MLTSCDRCGEPTHFVQQCPYCGRWVCNSCVKAIKRLKSTRDHLIICKDCWGKMESRKAWKSAL